MKNKKEISYQEWLTSKVFASLKRLKIEGSKGKPADMVHSSVMDTVQIRLKNKKREQVFNQSCIDSYNQFLETGFHVTQDEIDTWIDSLEANEPKEIGYDLWLFERLDRAIQQLDNGEMKSSPHQDAIARLAERRSKIRLQNNQ